MKVGEFGGGEEGGGLRGHFVRVDIVFGAFGEVGELWGV